MTYILVDVEANGPCPGLYSMIEIGAVAIEDKKIGRSFFGKLRPMHGAEVQEAALKAIGRTHEETLLYPEPEQTIGRFFNWVSKFDKPMFVSDNNGFDWQFINYYFHFYCNINPFGFSSTNLGSLYKGMVNDMTKNFKHLRVTKHTHNAEDDARGNAEAMVKMFEMGLKSPR